MSDLLLSPTQAAPWGASRVSTTNLHDGQVLKFILLHHGVPVADVENSGHGGETYVRWRGLTSTGEAVRAEFNSPALQKIIPTIQAARTAWLALLASIPRVPFRDKELKVSSGWLAEEVVAVHDLKKKCLKKLCFVVNGKEYALNGPDTPEARTWLSRKHPGATILNDVWGPNAGTPVVPVALPTPARAHRTLAELMAMGKG